MFTFATLMTLTGKRSSILGVSFASVDTLIAQGFPLYLWLITTDFVPVKTNSAAVLIADWVPAPLPYIAGLS